MDKTINSNQEIDPIRYRPTTEVLPEMVGYQIETLLWTTVLI